MDGLAFLVPMHRDPPWRASGRAIAAIIAPARVGTFGGGFRGPVRRPSPFPLIVLSNRLDVQALRTLPGAKVAGFAKRWVLR
ncbi:hypothetical protein M2324_002560 [Rhodovulum sulfidophilum]|nr:hypothetical protein A6W98_08180 [Rhodovulum sulfidophilum DSM 1374]ANB37869.1 hypothetical protein A6024_08035 [Rhodovulum sulfidophilum]MCW2304155.1 hypothetical protein [Rhodovulum sulfidophilum]